MSSGEKLLKNMPHSEHLLIFGNQRSLSHLQEFQDSQVIHHLGMSYSEMSCLVAFNSNTKNVQPHVMNFFPLSGHNWRPFRSFSMILAQLQPVF